VGRAAHRTRAGRRVRRQVEDGHAEVEQLDEVEALLRLDHQAHAHRLAAPDDPTPALERTQEDVGRLEPAVHDARFVGGAEPARDLPDHVDGLEERQALHAAQALAQALPLEVLGREKHGSVRRGADLEHLDHARMADALGAAGVAQELLDLVLELGVDGMQDLDRGRLAGGVTGSVDGARSPFADEGLELVVADSCAHARHGLGRDERGRVLRAHVHRRGEAGSALGTQTRGLGALLHCFLESRASIPRSTG